MYCSNCGAPLNESDVFCPKCGARKDKAAPDTCSNCGAPIEKGAKFCVNCGTTIAQPVQGYVAGRSQRSRLVAGLLGILLGGLGVHNFYLGFNTRAVIQILVTICTCGIGAIWGLVEGILILAKNINVDADGMPLSDEFR